MLGLEEGKSYDFFRARAGVERIEEHLREGGWLQSRVRVQRQGDDHAVNVTLQVRTGPRVELQFVGATPPGSVIEDVETQWNRGVFDTQRIDDGNEALLAWLMTDNYLRPKIDGTRRGGWAESTPRGVPHRTRHAFHRRSPRIRRCARHRSEGAR